MIGDLDGDFGARQLVHLLNELANRQVAAEQVMRRNATHRKNNLGRNLFDLGIQVSPALLRLVDFGVTIIGRAALDDIGNENLFARDADSLPACDRVIAPNARQRVHHECLRRARDPRRQSIDLLDDCRHPEPSGYSFATVHRRCIAGSLR